ncbi:MAG TPA: response regulator [Bacteroidetes bacterium]|nr:response regulator [Bacteroidota bacterium]
MAKILVIDDEPYILLMIKKMLEQAGHGVDLASNGKEGLELLLARPFDLLITDIVMPEKEGLETIREVRKKYPDLKIIAISGGGRLDSSEYLEPARYFGAEKIIKKPFQKGELLNAVNELLGGEK